MFIFISNISIANTPSKDLKDYYIHGKRPTVLMLKIKKFEELSPEKNKLSYKDDKDLIETCKIICKYSNKIWSEYDLTTFAIKESRLSHKALNRLDGGKGLFQLTKIEKWYKKELNWITNPYDKIQNIKGALIILDNKLEIFGSKHEAIKRFNGSSNKSNFYRKDFYNIRSKLMKL